MRPLLATLSLLPAVVGLATAPLRAQGPAPKPVPPGAAQGGAGRVVRQQAPVRVQADSGRADAEVAEVGLRYAATVRGCYEREGLRQDPTLGGTIEVTMTVLPQGIVREVSVDTSDVHGVGMGSVRACVSQAAVGWRFAPGAFGIERIAIPFSLVPPAADSTRTSSNRD